MKMAQPSKGSLWLHIDRLDRADGKVWAVQYWRHHRHVYKCFRAVILEAAGHSLFFGPKANQPRAVIAVPRGCIRVKDWIAVISAEGD